MLHWLNVQLNGAIKSSASRRCRRYDFDVFLIISLNGALIGGLLLYFMETADRTPVGNFLDRETISQMAISICHVQFFSLSFRTAESIMNLFLLHYNSLRYVHICIDKGRKIATANKERTGPECNKKMMAIGRVIVSVCFIVYDSSWFLAHKRPWQSFSMSIVCKIHMNVSMIS